MKGAYAWYGGIAAAVIIGLVGATFMLSSVTYPAPSSRVLADNGTVPDPSPLPPFPYSEERIALQIHDMVNQYRMQNNVTAVSWDDGLATLAKGHSIDMNLKGYFAHDGPDGTVLERSRLAGFEICGDREASTIAMSYEQSNRDFAIKQDQHNEKVRDLNTMSDSYTARQKQYEQDKLFQSKFSQSDQITYLRLQKQSQELEQEYQRLNNVESSLRAEDQALLAQHKDLEKQAVVIDQYVLQHAISIGVSENLMLGYTYSGTTETASGITFDWMTEDEISRRVVDGWINSPEHRENLVGQFFQSEGLGVSIDFNTNKILVTEDFC